MVALDLEGDNMKWWTVIKNKKLTDKQKKHLDKNKDGSLTAEDFRQLAEENKKIPQKRSKSRKGGNSAFLARD
mgnify:FL=1